MIKKITAMILSVVIAFAIAIPAFAKDVVDIPFAEPSNTSAITRDYALRNCTYVEIKGNAGSFKLGFYVSSTKNSGGVNNLIVCTKDYNIKKPDGWSDLNVSTELEGVNQNGDKIKFDNTYYNFGYNFAEALKIVPQVDPIGQIDQVWTEEHNPVVGEYSCRLVLRDKKNDLSTNPLDFVLVIEDDIFNKPYKKIKLYCDKTYVKIYGEEYEENESADFYILPSSFSKSEKYNGLVLPSYDDVRGVGKGLKVTGYVLSTADGRFNYVAGDLVKPGTTYYIKVAIDFSNPANMIPGIFNYIIFQIFSSGYYKTNDNLN